ncbi:MAG: SDR family NAD(P)-dependent oxidoreductase, partial [Bacillota bacterium]
MDLAPLSELTHLSNRSAIVTGGAMGIGFGIAYRLAEAGAGVVIADMNKVAADEAAAKIKAKGWKATPINADVTNPADVEKVVGAALKSYGSVNILVNNAGIYPIAPVMQLSQAEFDRIIAVNLKGAFLCTQAVAAQMIKQGKGGKIINITSVDAIHPSNVGLATYDASKHGLWGFTKNVALELAPHKIWVNAIAPGGVSTPGTGADKPASKEMEKILSSFRQRI